MLSINMDDVIAVISSCRNYLIAMAAFLILALIATVAVKGLAHPKRALARAGSWLSCLVAVTVALNLMCAGPLASLLTLISGKGTISQESSGTANALCVELAEEGIVLLQNDNGLLSLGGDAKVNVFGWASVSPVYGGTGSGGLSDSIPKTDLLTGLANAGIAVNQELADFYAAYMPERPQLGYDVHTWDLPEPPASAYPDALISGAKDFSDTAVIVISRIGGEFADLLHDMDLINTNPKESYKDNSTEYADFPVGTNVINFRRKMWYTIIG